MNVMSAPTASVRPPAEWFTATVWQDPMGDGEGWKAARVLFEPGARTHWHSHEADQFLVVMAGHGRIANRAGDASEFRAGDVIQIPAGEEHWHGAAPDALTMHLAITQGETNWLEEVAEEDYTRAM